MRIRDKIIHNSSNQYRLGQNSIYVNYPENKMNEKKKSFLSLKVASMVMLSKFGTVQTRDLKLDETNYLYNS